ncbi:hypothetical protein [Cohnella mopanensis]|uniref:hypothetical protein n=1 Tax=Cohnella mopanensis TaxID=2911966 RepID=UPI001EF75663|nr:hypothetical protein [Cohnella mopanensis]
MENHAEPQAEVQPPQPYAVEKVVQKPLISHPLFILTLSLVVISLIGIGFLYSTSLNNNKRYETQQKVINDQIAKINSLTKETESLKRDASKIKAIDEKTVALAKNLFIVAIQHEIEGGVVTDDFTVEKINLSMLDGNKLVASIDLNTQPQMSLLYKGKGSFDLSDRELRAKSAEIIKAVKTRYTTSAGDPMPSWDDSSVYLTIKNYDIGNTSSGEFALVGEK